MTTNNQLTVESIREQVQAYQKATVALEMHRRQYHSIKGPIGRILEAQMTAAFTELIGCVGEKFAVLLSEIDEYQIVVDEIADSRWDK